MRRGLSIIILFIVCFMQSVAASGQSITSPLRFIAMLSGRPVVIEETASQGNQALRISTFRCYVSNISLWQDKNEVWQETNSYHLLDAEKPERLLTQLTVPKNISFNSIHFNLGVDSATSASGAHGGDLDPMNGMYWAWQSGYINFKLEGFSPLITGRKHEFRFHLGGYQYPYLAMQPVVLAVKSSAAINIQIELGEFFSGIDFSKQNSVMIPGEEAVLLAQKASRIFHIVQ